jgi:hypothetical protein
MAGQRGRRREFNEAVAFIYEQLRKRPLEWGDPQYHLHAMGLLICRGIHEMLQVYYGVDEASRLVFIKEFEPVPCHPFERD